MDEQELQEGIDRAMATTVQSVKMLGALLNALSAIGTHVESVADQVNCMAMNVALEALDSEKSGTTLSAVAEEARLLESHALKVLVEVSQRVQNLTGTLDWPVSVSVSQIRRHG
jgi:hypothetical protein